MSFIIMRTINVRWTWILIIISVSLRVLTGEEVHNQKTEGPVIHSSFNPLTGTWNLSWPGRISQYDLVCLSPPSDPMQGIPLGNGDTGVLIWCENSKIIAAINKSDLWDDALFGTFHNWNSQEEDYSTTLRHACRVVIDFKYPVFNILYLSDFSAKLSLADGSFYLNATGPFGEVSLKAFVDHDSGMLLYNLGSDLNEDVPIEISVERYGSRTFSHWYSQINRDASIGLSGTEAVADSDGIFIIQKLSSGTFSAGGTVVSNNGLKADYSRVHSRCAAISLSGRKHKDAWLAFNVTSPDNNDPSGEIKKELNSARIKGPEVFVRSNEQAWKSLWHRSFIDYGDDYLNNLWYLTMYYANASQGGKYPGRFNNGLWSWNSDVQNWNFYFHWNQQQIYWPLNAAGFHELVDPYLNFRFASLPMAKKDAIDIFHADGAFISDVTERRGYNSANENANHTPVAEIALDFWRQYRYTCDTEFLERKALPFIIEAARFFESLVEKGPDGLYHAKKGTGYEGWIELKDGLTELVYTKALYQTALEVLKEAGRKIPEEKKWKDIILNLAPLPAIRADGPSVIQNKEEFRLLKGPNKNKTVPSDSIFAAGWGIKENRYLTVYYPVEDTVNSGFRLLDGIFPSVPSCPVFPSGLIGLNQKGSNLFDIATTTTLLYGREITGWDPVPVVLARLGMKDELAKDLNNFPARWQIYCNGWGHWGLEGEVNKDAELFFRTNMVKDAANPEGEKFPFPMWPFRHMSMESMSVLATAMNESLLQSYDGTIRVFPAFPSDRRGRFTLHARGGFIISSEVNSGKIEWIGIKSLKGNICRIEIPWVNAYLKSSMKSGSKKIAGKIIEIKTSPEEFILLSTENSYPDKWIPDEEQPAANDKVKYNPSGKARLGIPKLF